MKTILLLLTLSICQICYCQSDQWFYMPTKTTPVSIVKDCENLWINLGFKLLSYNLETGESRYYQETNSPIDDEINDVAIDANGVKYISTANGIVIIDNNEMAKINFDNFSGDTIFHKGISTIVTAPNNLLFILDTYHHLYILDRNENSCKFIDDFVFSITKNHNGEIFFAKNKYLQPIFIYKYTDSVYLTHTIGEIPFESNVPGSLYFDNDDNLWVTIDYDYYYGKEEEIPLDGGMMVYKNGVWIEFTPEDIGLEHGSGFNELRQSEDGTFYIPVYTDWDGTFYPITINIDLNTETIQQVMPPKEPISDNLLLIDNLNTFYYSHQNNIYLENSDPFIINCYDAPVSNTTNFAVDLNNDLWVLGSDLVHVNKNTPDKVYNDYNSPITFAIAQNNRSMKFDSLGNLWIINGDKILKFDGTNWEITTELDLDLLNHNEILDVAFDKNNNPWILCENNLFFSNNTNFEEVQIAPMGYGTAKTITYIDSNFYIGCNFSMLVFDGTNWNQFNSENSNLPYIPNISSIIDDNNGQIWVSGDSGIFQFTDFDFIKISDLNTDKLLLDKLTNTLWCKDITSLIKFINADSIVIYNNINSPYLDSYTAIFDGYGNLIMDRQYFGGIISIFNENGILGYEENLNIPSNIAVTDCRYGLINDDGSLVEFPNPSSGEINLNYYLNSMGEVNISLFNLSGIQISQLVNEISSEGLQRKSFDLSYLSSGIYFIRANFDGKQEIVKFSIF